MSTTNLGMLNSSARSWVPQRFSGNEAKENCTKEDDTEHSSTTSLPCHHVDLKNCTRNDPRHDQLFYASDFKLMAQRKDVSISNQLSDGAIDALGSKNAADEKFFTELLNTSPCSSQSPRDEIHTFSCSDNDTIMTSCVDLPCVNFPTDIDEFVYSVRFKRNTRFFLRSASSPSIPSGTLVRVEGDRGEDIGTYISRETIRDFVANVNSTTPAAQKITHREKRLLRAATEVEQKELFFKKQEEDNATFYIQDLINNKQLNITVRDTEFQFDMRKLTVFFEADNFVQFHQLVRDIYKVYKTRIWLEQVGGTGSLCRSKSFDQGDKHGIMERSTLSDLSTLYYSETAITQNMMNRSLNDITNSIHLQSTIDHMPCSSSIVQKGEENIQQNTLKQREEFHYPPPLPQSLTNTETVSPFQPLWSSPSPLSLLPLPLSSLPPSSAAKPAMRSTSSGSTLSSGIELDHSSFPTKPLDDPVSNSFSRDILGNFITFGLLDESIASRALDPNYALSNVETNNKITDKPPNLDNLIAKLSFSSVNGPDVSPAQTNDPSNSSTSKLSPTTSNLHQENDQEEQPLSLQTIQHSSSSMESAIPVDFICGITCEVMIDPATCADGFDYEHDAIIAWLSRHATSPRTKELLPNKNVTPNHKLRSAINRYRGERIKEHLNRLSLED